MKRSSPVGIGIITILTVLLILCLSAFAVLAVASAGADLRLSRTAAEKCTAYYTADVQAARIYAAFAAGDAPSLETSVKINDTQELSLRFSRNNQGKAVVNCWRVFVIESVPDESLPVWTGD